MKVKEAAQKYGITEQAIYTKLKRKGIDIKQLKDSSTGELTAEGEALFTELFTKREQVQTKEVDNLTSRLISLESENKKLTEQNEVLRNENEALMKRIADLEGAYTNTVELAQGLQRSLDKAQELHRNAQELHRQDQIKYITGSTETATDGTQGATGGLITRLRKVFRR